MTKGAATKQSILDEATRLASQVGLGGLTIGSLASQTQLSKSGLFAHFRSKESLQIDVLRHGSRQFTDVVIRPALAAPRGEPRVRAFFEGWLVWMAGSVLPGGCLMTSAATELDDKPGAVRDELVQQQRDLMETVARIFQTGITEGHFRQDADPDQFTYDLYGIILAYNHRLRLMHDPAAEDRARQAFEALLDTARPTTD